MGSWYKRLSLGLALALLIYAGQGTLPRVSAQQVARSKVSSTLDLRIKTKLRLLAQGMQVLPQGASILPPDGPHSGTAVDLLREKVYIHFARQPTAAQLGELTALGIAVYPNSWLPPTGNNSTGFVLADMPVDKLDALATKSYILRLNTTEQILRPQNDLGRAAMNVDAVWTAGYTGTGVRVAVLDSGLDTAHGDIPAPTASKDYSNYPTLDDTIGNTVTGHGTHVTGSVLGRGNLNASYKGSAPNANLIFIKIGRDSDAAATTDAMVYAMRDAVAAPYNAKVITMSYGGWSTYHDGTDETSQAVDYAVSQGATVFIAAGNEANDAWHYSGTVGPNTTTGFIQVTVASGTSSLPMNLVWYDGPSTSNILRLKYYNSSQTEITAVTTGSQSQSLRGTESVESAFNGARPAGTYYLTVQNSSASSQFFHIYYQGGLTTVTFASPDTNYTLGSPAEADSAIAVGAYVTRSSWTNYQGTTYSYSPAQTLNSITTFSSGGPRVDGSPGKPNIVAPGSAIISARDSFYTLGGSDSPAIIKTSGTNNGLAPADYYVMQGTSMATPLAAGVGALLKNKTSTLTPAQVRHALESTATDQGDAGRDNTYGWGLVNALSASTASTIFASYSDAAHNTATADFSSYATQHTAYMYGTGFLNSHTYRIAYYDGANNKVATEDVASSATGDLSSQHTFVQGTDNAGTWNVIVSEPEFTPAVAYSSSWAYTIVSDTFTVQQAAIPEFPTVLAAIGTIALCAGIYIWMRRKKALVPA